MSVRALRSRSDRILIFLVSLFFGAALSLGWNPTHWGLSSAALIVGAAAVGFVALWRYPQDHTEPAAVAPH